jgi:hypothetical protein
MLNNQLSVESDAAVYTLGIGTGGIADPVHELQGTTLTAIRIGFVNDGLAMGGYPVDLGIVVADTRNSRRMEAFVAGIHAEVSASGIAVTIPAGASIRFSGRSVDGMTEIASTLTNLQANGPITGASDSLIFNLAGLQQRLVESFAPGSASGELVRNILSTGTFAYTILMKSAVPMGHYGATGAFTAFPWFNIGPYGGEYGANLARLLESPIAKTAYLDGMCYVIRGSIGVGAGNFAPLAGDAPTLNPGGGGGGGVVPPPGVITDGSTVTADVTNLGTVNGITLAAGILVNNVGVINSVTLQAGASITGGTVSGIIAGQGTGAEITNALIDAVSISNVTIGFGCRVTQNTVANNPGLDLTAAVTGADGVIDTATPILVDAAGNTFTLAQLLEIEVNDQLGDSTCRALDDAAGNTIVSAGNLGNVVVPSVITSVVTTAEPDGVSFTASGELRIVENGIAFIMAPASADEPSFAAAMQGINAIYGEDRDQVVTVSLPDGARLVFRFDDFALRPGAVASIAAVGSSFSLTGDPADPASYCLMITYPDGTTQKMPPFIHALGMFKTLAESAGVGYRILPSTGAIELLGPGGEVFYRGRPDYLLGNPDGTPTGISFELAGDVNGDGFPDVRMITPTATQIIFSLP